MNETCNSILHADVESVSLLSKDVSYDLETKKNISIIPNKTLFKFLDIRNLLLKTNSEAGGFLVIQTHSHHIICYI